MQKLALTLGFLSLLAAPARAEKPAGSSEKSEKAVLAAMDVWKQAMLKKDKAAFEKVLHNDLSYGHSSGVVDDKATTIKKIVESKNSYEAIDLSDTHVKVHGDTALVSGKAEYKERENGKLSVANLVVLSVWVKSPQGWQMIGRQATKPPVPGAATATAAAPAVPGAPAAPSAPAAAAKK
jgi:ketosteroid isomerase-like protein